MRLTPLIVGLTCLVQGAAASAQTASTPAPEAKPPTTFPLQVQFDVEAGMVYDDNLFWQPVATDDTILRISPMFDARRESSRASFSARYRLDAERYTHHP